MNKKLILLILDGWGIGNKGKADVISSVATPNMDLLQIKYPVSRLLACGEDVGLPDGQMGNSEVGHLNIGAGRIVYQDLVRINLECRSGKIKENKQLISALTYAKENNKSVHFLGLVSDGGVHSMDTHLYALCDLTKDYNLKKVFIHALTDGRDTDPHSGLGYLTNLNNHIENTDVKVATLSGRYYTMDRDKRWERIRAGYDAMVNGIGNQHRNMLEAIEESYRDGITDEFIKPTVFTDEQGNPIAKIQKDDVVICFNFRTDRLRQITMALTQTDMPENGMKTIPLNYFTMTRYDDSFKGITIIYDKENVTHTLGEVIEENGKTQLRIAETEKYAHVTFFFSGGREQVFKGENRILIPSPKVATYDLQPEMSAPLVRDAVVKELKKGSNDFICLNFANGDMVGHTGIYKAIEKAVRTVDECVGDVIRTALDNGYEAMIIADHGNADYAINEDGSPNTAHSLNPVPCILVSERYKKIKDGRLSDVAPTILTIMGLPVPEQMTGNVLV